MRHTGLYFTERDEHLDLFTTDKHEAGHTTGDTVWKGALTGESRASYEGLIHIVPKAPGDRTPTCRPTRCCSRRRRKGDAIPSLIVETDNVSASHGGTVGELDEEQIFYMMTRGIPRAEAVRVLVEGYFEEVVQRLDDPGLEDARAAADRREARGRRGPGARVHRGARGGGLMAVAPRPGRPRRLPGARPRDQRAAARLPRLGGHLAEAAPRDRRDGSLLLALARQRPPRRLRARRARPPTCSRARASASPRSSAGTPTPRSSPATPPRRSTWSPTRGAARTSARATRCSSPRWSTTRTSCPGSSLCEETRRDAALPVGVATTASCRSTSSTRCSPSGGSSSSPSRTSRTCSARSTPSPRSPAAPARPARSRVIDGAQAVPQMPVDLRRHRRGLLRLDRPQGARPRHGRAARPPRAARGDAAVPRRRRHDLARRARPLDLERAALEVRGRHLADRRGGRPGRRDRLPGRDRHGERARARARADRLRARAPARGRGHRALRPAERRQPRRRRVVRDRGHPPARHRRAVRPRGGLHPRRPPLRAAADALPGRGGDGARVLPRLQRARGRRPAGRTRWAARARCSTSAWTRSTATTSSTTTRTRGTSASSTRTTSSSTTTTRSAATSWACTSWSRTARSPTCASTARAARSRRRPPRSPPRS